MNTFSKTISILVMFMAITSLLYYFLSPNTQPSLSFILGRIENEHFFSNGTLKDLTSSLNAFSYRSFPKKGDNLLESLNKLFSIYVNSQLLIWNLLKYFFSLLIDLCKVVGLLFPKS